MQQGKATFNQRHAVVGTRHRILLAGASCAAMLAVAPTAVQAIDYRKVDTAEDTNLLWSLPNTWEPGGQPGATDRAIFDGTGRIAVAVGDQAIGQIVWTGAATTGFLPSFPDTILTVHGIDGIGVDHQGTQNNQLYNWIDLAADQIWQATNVAGGGFAMDILGSGRTNIGTHTLTVDLVNASNTGQLNALEGSGDLVKIGLGALTLPSDSALFTGETRIEEGTLALSNGGSIVNSSRVVADGTFDISGLTGDGTRIQRLSGNGFVTLGTKHLTVANANDSFAGVISGDGGLVIENGSQTLSGDNLYLGPTTVAGILAAGAENTFSAASGHTVLGGAGLLLNGFSQTIASLDNAGHVSFGGDTPGTTLTIAGDYTSNGGTIELHAELGDDSSPADMLHVTGSTSGNTNVRVINLGGAGAATNEGIRIVQVDGVSDGDFSLLGDYVFEGDQAIVAGPYAYRLNQGSASASTDGDWYLHSSLIPASSLNPGQPTAPLYQPGAPLYEAYAGALLGFIDIGTLQQRVGNRQWAVVAPDADGVSDVTEAQRQLGAWAEVRGFSGKWKPETTTSGTDYDLASWKIRAGVDVPVADLPNGDLIGGVNLHYGTFKADVDSIFGTGSIDGSGFGAGGTLTYYADDGFYVDGQAQATWFDSDLDSSTLGRKLVEGNEGVGYALGLEAGKRIALSSAWSTTPQAQLTYSAVDFDDFTDPFGAAVSLDSADSFAGRLGTTLDRQAAWEDAEGRINRSHLYSIANLYYDFDGGSKVDLSGVGLENKNDAFWGGVGIGGSLNFADNRYSIYGEGLAKTSLENFGDSYSLSGVVGFRVQW